MNPCSTMLRPGDGPNCIRLLLSIGLILCGVGCAAPRPSPAEREAKLQEFLQDGKTTREQVILKLGEPSGQFESQRILTYRASYDYNGEWRTVDRVIFVSPNGAQTSWEGAMYSLVLVFDGNVLRKHSLVPMK